MKGPSRLVRSFIALGVILLLGSRASLRAKTQDWTEVRTPHFLVVTNASERDGRQLAYQFEAIRSVFEQTLRVSVEPGKPFVIMGFKDEKSLRAAMPEHWKKKGQKRLGGGFVPSEDKIYAFVLMDVEGDDSRRIIYHEYTHMVLHISYPSLPLWVNEGLAEFYGFSLFGEKETTLGQPDSNYILVLREGRMLPLAELFRVSYDSPYYTEAAKAPMFYAESWALTHYLMFAERTEAGQGNRLTQFLSLLDRGVGRDEATRQVFNDPANLQAALESYVKRRAMPVLRMMTATAGTPKDFVARVLSPAEAAARLGDFQLHDRRPKDARPLLEEALRLQPDLGSAQESLGFVFMRLGDRAEALRWLDRAIAGGSGSFLAHFYHAMLTLDEMGMKDGSGQAEASLKKAIQLNPDFAPAHIALARIYFIEDKTADRALEHARKAVDIVPGNLSYQLMLGDVLVRLGRYDEAMKLARMMERSASSQAEKGLVRSFIESVNRAQEKKGPKLESSPGSGPWMSMDMRARRG